MVTITPEKITGQPEGLIVVGRVHESNRKLNFALQDLEYKLIPRAK